MTELVKIAIKLLIGAIAATTGGVLIKKGAEEAYEMYSREG